MRQKVEHKRTAKSERTHVQGRGRKPGDAVKENKMMPRRNGSKKKWPGTQKPAQQPRAWSRSTAERKRKVTGQSLGSRGTSRRVSH